MNGPALYQLNRIPHMGSRIKLLAFDRADPADVIRLALGGLTQKAFAAKHDFSEQEVSQCLTGYRRHEKVRAALAEELGVERGEVDELLDRKEAASAA